MRHLLIGLAGNEQGSTDEPAMATVNEITRTGPLVSAVIPVHNSEETIARSIESVLAQSYQPIEIVVVDDYSSDNTTGIVKSFAARGVRLVQLRENLGASGARNRGISAANGNLVAFLDADDEWLPTKIAKQVALITKQPELVFVSCAAKLISTNGEDLGDLYRWRRPTAGVDCWKSLLAHNTIATPSVLAWRRHLVALGGFDQRLKICEDQDMWIRLALLGHVGYLDECLVFVHARPGSLSSKSAGHARQVVLDVVQRHIAEQRLRLTAAEIRAILGERLEWLGRTECNENYWKGLPTLFRSMLTGYRPLHTLAFLANVSPAARSLKTCLRLQSRSIRHHPAGGAEPFQPSADIKTTTLVGPSRHPMLPLSDDALVKFPPDSKPRLVVIIDGEEQYDWRLPLSRFNTNVRSMAAQCQAQKIYRCFGVVPTYAIDYPVVVNEAGYRTILEMLQAGECELGAQLHAWVTPPHDEEVCERNSYAGNLPAMLERQKLETLVEAIERRFGARPLLYRAGRYGTGSNTAAIIDDLGFEIDCSVVPEGTWNSPDAPNYAGATAHPYWLQTRRPVLEIPVTVGTTGAIRRLGADFYRRIKSNEAVQWRVPGILARTGLLNRVRLSPEGNTIEECKQMTRRLVADGHRVFAISYHTPSLEPGNTPYVRDRRDLARFLNWIDQYLEFFLTEMNGIADTPRGVYAWATAYSPRAVRPLPAGQRSPSAVGSLPYVG